MKPYTDVLKGFSNDDLQDELDRRERAKLKVPPLVKNPNIAGLQDYIVAELKGGIEGGCFSDDMDHYIYEKTMETLFGKDFWKWYNNLPWM